MPDQPLTREQAAALAVDNTFDAGWSARDAEVADQQITITQLRDTLAECLKCVPVFDGQAGNPLYAKVRKLLKRTEPVI